MKNFKKIIFSLYLLFRDISLILLPVWVARKFFGTYDFVFIGHPLIIEDYKKKYEFFKNPMASKLLDVIYPYLWPILGEKIQGFKSSNNIEIKGRAIFCPLTAKQIVSNRKLRFKKVFASIKMAEKLGAKIVGLGGFTSIATNDGLSLLNSKIKTSLTTGNAYSAVVAVQNLFKIFSIAQQNIKNQTVAIVGAAGSVGSGCAKYIGIKAKQLILVDINMTELKNLVNKLKVSNTTISIIYGSSIDLVKDADGIIVATSAPYEIISSGVLKNNAIIVDAAQPHNVAKKAIAERPDIIVIDSAIVKVKGLKTNFDYGYYGTDEIMGCMGELLILSWIGHYSHFSLGKVSIEQMDFLWELSQKIGIQLAEFRNQIGPISEESIRAKLNNSIIKKYVSNL